MDWGTFRAKNLEFQLAQCCNKQLWTFRSVAALVILFAVFAAAVIVLWLGGIVSIVCSIVLKGLQAIYARSYEWCYIVLNFCLPWARCGFIPSRFSCQMAYLDPCPLAKWEWKVACLEGMYSDSTSLKPWIIVLWHHTGYNRGYNKPTKISLIKVMCIIMWGGEWGRCLQLCGVGSGGNVHNYVG